MTRTQKIQFQESVSRYTLGYGLLLRLKCSGCFEKKCKGLIGYKLVSLVYKLGHTLVYVLSQTLEFDIT